MKIVIVTQGSLGDVRPFLSLGIAFRKRGHEVIVCAPKNFKTLFLSYGMSFRSVGVDFQSITMTGVGEVNKSQQKRIVKLLVQSISDQFTLLPALAKDANVIIGNGLDFAGRSIAEYYKIPYFIIVSMPLALKSKYHAPMAVPFQNLPSWLNTFFWWTGEFSSKMMFGKKINHHRHSLGLKKMHNYVKYMSKDAILAADSILAPLPPDCNNVFQSGYIDLEEETELDQDIVNFIDGGSAPIYVGFGSMADPEPEKTSKLLQNLIKEDSFRYIISKGWANLGIRTDKKNVLFVNHVSHSKLFPKMEMIIHHGGAGTTSAATRAGTPQIIIPHGLDQFYWGPRVKNLRIGPNPIPRSKLDSDRLLEAIKEVASNHEYKENARKIGSIVRERNGINEAIKYISTKLGRAI